MSVVAHNFVAEQRCQTPFERRWHDELLKQFNDSPLRQLFSEGHLGRPMDIDRIAIHSTLSKFPPDMVGPPLSISAVSSTRR